MIRRMTVVLTAIALSGAAQPALAQDALSHSYWDAAYLSSKVEVGSASDTFEGFRLAAGVGLAKFLNFTADYDQIRFTNGSGREGYGSAGLAYHTQNPVYQFHGGVTYERYDFDNNTNSARDFEEEGYGVEVGARYALQDLGLHAAYRYLDFGTVDQTKRDFTGSRFEVGADLQLTAWWSLIADYRGRQHKFTNPSVTVDYKEWTVGLRHYFATDTDRLMRHGGLLSGWLSDDGEEAE